MIAALTNHLWQSTLFVVAAGLVAFALRKNGAHIRHRVWLVASLKFLVPFSVLMSLGGALPAFTPAATEGAATAPALSVTVDRLAQPFSDDVFYASPAAAPTQPTANWTAVIIVGTWACGFIAVAVMRLRGWQHIRAALRASTPVPVVGPGLPPSQGFGGLKPAAYDCLQVRSAPGLLEPGVVGLWRSVLLVPAGIERQLTPAQLDAVLAHEVCHVQRRDNLTSAIHMVVEAVFWFHPLVWFVGARLVDERERACDEHVLRVCGEPRIYAESILNVCKLYVESPIACVSGVGGSDLRKRVAAILLNRVGLQLNLIRKVTLAIATALAILAPVAAGALIAPLRAAVAVSSGGTDIVLPAANSPIPVVPTPGARGRRDLVVAPGPRAQTSGQASAARFDVVSIKACDPKVPFTRRGDPPPRGFRAGGAPYQAYVSPGYTYWDCVTLAQLVNQAYADESHPLLNIVDQPRQTAILNQPKRVRGGPAWVEVDTFAIEAKMSPGVTSPGLAGSSGKYLPMLPEGISLALRAVLEDRFKAKVRRATEQRDLYALTIAPGGLNTKTITVPVSGDCMTTAEYSEAVSAGQLPKALCGRSFSSLERGMEYSSFTLQQLARDLSIQLDRFVVDRTGVDTKFNFTIKADAAADGDGGRYAASLGALGLRLEPIKGPGEYLVIDSAERPTPNAPASADATAGGPAADASPSARSRGVGRPR